MSILELAEKKRAFIWGFCLATVTTIAVCILICLAAALFAGGPQTGRDHSVSASLTMPLIAIGLTQWIWLTPLLILSFRNNRKRFGWGILASGLVVASLNFPLVRYIFINRN